DFLQQVLSVHDWASDAGVASLPLSRACVLRASVARSEPRDHRLVNHKQSHCGCGTEGGIIPISNIGQYSNSGRSIPSFATRNGQESIPWGINPTIRWAGRADQIGRAVRTAFATAAVPSRPPNSHGLRPLAKARSTASSIVRAASAAPAWPC